MTRSDEDSLPVDLAPPEARLAKAALRPIRALNTWLGLAATFNPKMAPFVAMLRIAEGIVGSVATRAELTVHDARFLGAQISELVRRLAETQSRFKPADYDLWSQVTRAMGGNRDRFVVMKNLLLADAAEWVPPERRALLADAAEKLSPSGFLALRRLRDIGTIGTVPRIIAANEIGAGAFELLALNLAETAPRRLGMAFDMPPIEVGVQICLTELGVQLIACLTHGDLDELRDALRTAAQ